MRTRLIGRTLGATSLQTDALAQNRRENMLEVVGIAGFMMCVVFAVLFGIYLCVRLFSYITTGIESKLKKENLDINA